MPAHRPRATPWEYARQVVGELRSSRWPSPGTALRSTLLILGGLTAASVLIWVLDLLFVGLLSQLLVVVADVSAASARPLLLTLHVGAMVVAGYLLLKHPAPSGGVNLFGASASDAATGVTPSERRLDRRTAVAVGAYLVSGLVLALFFV